MKRYHVEVHGRLTTVSMDNLLSEYLALRLDQRPYDEKTAHTLVRRWIQEVLNRSIAPDTNVSQYIRDCALDFIADEKLKDLHDVFCKPWR